MAHARGKQAEISPVLFIEGTQNTLKFEVEAFGGPPKTTYIILKHRPYPLKVIPNVL